MGKSYTIVDVQVTDEDGRDQEFSECLLLACEHFHNISGSNRLIIDVIFHSIIQVGNERELCAYLNRFPLSGLASLNASLRRFELSKAV